MQLVLVVLLLFFWSGGVNAFSSISSSSRGFRRPMALHTHNEDDDKNVVSKFRRDIVKDVTTFGALLTAAATPANARSTKSRTVGYEVQHTEAEWSQLLSPQQNFILRQGGTESPYSSILEGEDRTGLFVCAGCGTPLFNSKEKFHSGTGWPSFAAPIMSTSNPEISNVEMENVSNIQYQLAGAEVRCHTCGGHLGDVFADGFLFPGTPAFATGKRYCIDGGALLFLPNDRSTDEVVRGDMPPAKGNRGPVFPG